MWALRRLSNGLEGVPWHSRTCTVNHHGHRCSCEAQGPVDDTNTRASISRIIMLAEALFEVWSQERMGSDRCEALSRIMSGAHIFHCNGRRQPRLNFCLDFVKFRCLMKYTGNLWRFRGLQLCHELLFLLLQPLWTAFQLAFI